MEESDGAVRIAHRTESMVDPRVHIALKSARRGADLNLQIEGDINRRRRVNLIAGQADSIQQLAQLQVLFARDRTGVLWIGNDENRGPAARPAEYGAGALDPIKLPRLLAVILP